MTEHPPRPDEFDDPEEVDEDDTDAGYRDTLEEEAYQKAADADADEDEDD